MNTQFLSEERVLTLEYCGFKRDSQLDSLIDTLNKVGFTCTVGDVIEVPEDAWLYYCNEADYE